MEMQNEALESLTGQAADQRRVDGLRERLGSLRQQSEDLRRQAGDFPALECNCRRVLASLKMMEIDLGMLTVPEN